MTVFIGKLHPLLVHLPIGMIFVAISIEWIGSTGSHSSVRNASRYILSIAFVSAILSLISGYLLSLEEQNPSTSVDLHKWLAIITSIFLFLLILIWNYSTTQKFLHHSLLIILLILVSVTGHFGGELTHGEGYLTLTNKKNNDFVSPPPALTNIPNANIYADVTKYIIKEKCESCHGNDRQKGKLRLDNIESIFKGGKSGKVIDLDNYSNSELIKRIVIDQSDDHHMPPKKETQLTLNEVKIMEWWVLNHCPTDKMFSSFVIDSTFKVTLQNYQNDRNKKSNSIQLIRKDIAAITQEQKNKLEKNGLIVSQISTEDHHIRVTAFNLEISIKNALLLLKEVTPQLIELKLGNIFLNDDDMDVISSFTSLEKLWIEHCQISDVGITKLGKLNNLIFLNISGNSITKKGMNILFQKNPMIKKIIAYDIAFNETELMKLRKNFKGQYLSIGKDTMNYTMSDTLFIKKIK